MQCRTKGWLNDLTVTCRFMLYRLQNEQLISLLSASSFSSFRWMKSVLNDLRMLFFVHLSQQMHQASNPDHWNQVTFSSAGQVYTPKLLNSLLYFWGVERYIQGNGVNLVWKTGRVMVGPGLEISEQQFFLAIYKKLRLSSKIFEWLF